MTDEVEKGQVICLKIKLDFSLQVVRFESSTCNFIIVSRLMSCLMSFLDNTSATMLEFPLANWLSVVNCEI